MSKTERIWQLLATTGDQANNSKKWLRYAALALSSAILFTRGPLAQLVERRTFNVGVSALESSHCTANIAHGYGDSS